jgi:hypothetical protein
VYQPPGCDVVDGHGQTPLHQELPSGEGDGLRLARSEPEPPDERAVRPHDLDRAVAPPNRDQALVDRQRGQAHALGANLDRVCSGDPPERAVDLVLAEALDVVATAALLLPAVEDEERAVPLQVSDSGRPEGDTRDRAHHRRGERPPRVLRRSEESVRT